jgi:hypothetical protein
LIATTTPPNMRQPPLRSGQFHPRAPRLACRRSAPRSGPSRRTHAIHSPRYTRWGGDQARDRGLRPKTQLMDDWGGVTGRDRRPGRPSRPASPLVMPWVVATTRWRAVWPCLAPKHPAPAPGDCAHSPRPRPRPRCKAAPRRPRTLLQLRGQLHPAHGRRCGG